MPLWLLRTLWGVLAPWWMIQGALVRWRTPVLPEPPGARHGVEGEGPVVLRVLIVGDSSAAGVGAEHQDEALGAQLARALVAQGYTAVAWHTVARSGHTVWSAREHLAAQTLRRADVLVTVFGVNETLERVGGRQYTGGLDALVGHVHMRAGVRRAVHCAPPPMGEMPALPQPLRWMMGSHAAMLDRALVRHLRGHRRRTRFALSFDPRHERAADWLAGDGFHPNAALYERWAQELASHIDVDLHTVPEHRAVRPSGFNSTFDLSTRPGPRL